MKYSALQSDEFHHFPNTQREKIKGILSILNVSPLVFFSKTWSSSTYSTRIQGEVPPDLAHNYTFSYFVLVLSGILQREHLNFLKTTMLRDEESKII